LIVYNIDGGFDVLEQLEGHGIVVHFKATVKKNLCLFADQK